MDEELKKHVNGKKVVTIGGGHGSSMVLQGLKASNNISLTHIVAMTDNGGSSARFREIPYNMGAPGDYTRNLLVLSERSELFREFADVRLSIDHLPYPSMDTLVFIALGEIAKKSGLPTGARHFFDQFEKSEYSNFYDKLFSFRFDEKFLHNDSMRNFLYAAARMVAKDEEEFLLGIHDLFGAKGKVLPSTWDNSILCAELEEGDVVRGETHIDNLSEIYPNGQIKGIYLEPSATAYSEACKAVEEADLLVLGPGDLYTSVIANLLASPLADSINKSEALKVYVCNLMTKPGETTDYTASQHLREINMYITGKPDKPGVDVILINNNGIDRTAKRNYRAKGSIPVKTDHDEIEALNVRAVVQPLYSGGNPIFHDPKRTAQSLLSLESALRGAA